MAAQTFNVDIDGYWRDINKDSIPKHSGVYFVYTAVYNANEKTVSLSRLIYIGESDNVHDRIAKHEKYDDCLKYLQKGQTLCFSTGFVETSNRVRVEAAYIFKHKPPVNTEYVDNFPFDQTRVISTGKTTFLNADFTVYRT